MPDYVIWSNILDLPYVNI